MTPRRPLRSLQSEAGQIAVVLVVFCAAMAVLAAALLQVGEATDQRARANTAADAAALAGAKAIGDGVTNLLRLVPFDLTLLGDLLGGVNGYNAAAQYAQQNGASLTDFHTALGSGGPSSPLTPTLTLKVRATIRTNDTTSPGPVRRIGGVQSVSTSAAEVKIDLLGDAIGSPGSSGGPVPGVPLGDPYPPGQCTWYAAGRLISAGYGPLVETPPYWGNAGDWPGRIPPTFHRDTAPVPGDVAVWLASTISPYGHVAIVDQVSGGRILVEDYNYVAPLTYGRHWMNGADVFINFPAMTGNADGLPGTPLPAPTLHPHVDVRLIPVAGSGGDG
jgi:surface antigen